MLLNSKQVCRSLETDVRATIEAANALRTLGDEAMNKCPEPGAWSLAQILEHLNSYNRYYLPEIEKALQKGEREGFAGVREFRPGFFGNYFTQMMQPPVQGKAFKMYKAPKDHTPPAALNAADVLEEFLKGQKDLLHLLQRAALADMGRLKVPVSISRLIKLRLGDTLRFLVAHQRRHFVQADSVLQVIDR